MKDFVTERLKLKDLYPERAAALAKESGIDVEDLELVRKGIVAEKAEVDKDERSVTSYINTAAKDRDNEVIEPKGVVLTHYRKNPIVPWAHDYRSLPVGKNIWIKKDDKGLLAKTVFLKHAFAEDVFRLYSEDVAGTGPAMKAWSIGFVPLKWETPELEEKGRKVDEADTRIKRTYKKWELLEYSPVPVPSNPEALTEMVAKGLIKSDKLKEEIIECVGDECKDIVLKPEETDDFIRIPVRDCKVTATITISEKQGITALYCGKIKKIRTYIFNKKAPYNWTMKKAQAWVKEHGKALDNLIDRYMDGGGTGKDLDVIELDIIKEMFADREVIGLEETTTNNLDTGTVLDDNGTYRNDITKEAQKARDSLKDTKFLKDENVFGKSTNTLSIEGNKYTIKISYSEEDEGYIAVAPELPGCSAFGETKEEAMKEIKVAIELHLETAQEEPKQTEREQQITKELFDRTTAQLNKIEKELKSLKEGRVLSAKNRKLVKQCADMLMVLYEATEPPQREEFELEVEEGKDPTHGEAPKKEVEIDKDSLTENIASIIKNRIGEMVQNAINKARGKVE